VGKYISHMSISWLIIGGSLLTAGCANLAAVKGYSDETKKLTASFEPMLSGSVAACEDRYMRDALFTHRQFDLAEERKHADELCSPIKTANEVIAPLNTLLAAYADTLLALADDKLPSYKGELDGLSKALGSVKKPNGEAVLEAKQLTAVNSLAEYVSRMATQRNQVNAIKEALGHHESISTIAEILKDYATRNYGGYIDDQLREFPTIVDAVRTHAQTEVLASRYLEIQLAADKSALEEKKKAIDSYVAAVDKMVAAHKDLADHVDQLDAPERLKLIAAYAKEVYALQKQVQQAF